MYDLNKSRITPYLTERYKEAFLFDTLAAGYWDKDPRFTFMKDVPVPFRPEDVKGLKEGGLSIARMGENMLFVTGMDPAFPYVGRYVDYIRRCFAVKVREAFLHDAGDAMEKGDFLRACVLFRGVLTLTRSDADAETGGADTPAAATGGAYECDALFGLAGACSEMSRKLEEAAYADETDEESRAREEKCGNFKAEAMELYETLTFAYPDFAPAWYYLGYCYLNMGLYAKTDLCFKKYLALADPETQKDEIKEIEERRDQLTDPITIEQGCNAVIAGRAAEGIALLEPYRESQFRNWWPMHYYLAQAYVDTGRPDDAVAAYREVLRISPSNIETLLALSELYDVLGNAELAEKYRRKYQLLIN